MQGASEARTRPLRSRMRPREVSAVPGRCIDLVASSSQCGFWATWSWTARANMTAARLKMMPRRIFRRRSNIRVPWQVERLLDQGRGPAAEPPGSLFLVASPADAARGAEAEGLAGALEDQHDRDGEHGRVERPDK